MSNNCLKYPFIDGFKDFPTDKDQEVKEIRKWLETQPQVPKLNEEFLYLFLHCNYYKLQETKNNIKAYFSFRSCSKDIYSDRSLSNAKVRNALSYISLGFSPKRTPEGYQVVFGTLNEKNLQNFSHLDTTILAFIFFDVMISEFALTPGYVLVCDAKLFTLSIFLKINIGLILKKARYFQEAAPVRVKHIIFLNSASYVYKLYALCRPFLSAELIKKLQFHEIGSDLTTFYKTVPRDCIFEEYGGTAGTVEDAHVKFTTLLESKYCKWIEDESVYTSEEPKRAKRSFFSFW